MNGMAALVYSSSLAAAFLGGVLALFAPCCVVSLLPTFAGAALREGKLRLPVTTAVFAAGVAAVLLPVVLGIGALGQLFGAYHRLVYLIVGGVLAVLGVAALSGRSISLPMPSLRVRTQQGGISGTFLLGMVSGIVSACCAPVLAGVVAMSALGASTVGALGLGLTYVFGMVFPLFLAALFWERLGSRFQRPFTARRIRLGGNQVLWTDFSAGVIFLIMAALALYIAATGQSTLTPDFLTAWTRWATGIAGGVAVALQRVPTAWQALALVTLAFAIGAPVYAAWKRHPTGEPQVPNDVPMADVTCCTAGPLRSGTSARQDGEHEECGVTETEG
ncbi:MAG: cytochrome c biogenesis protein CcdA [bacterium]|nr:cytochrome c biogenesis protein CcdA [bacterium]